MKTRLTICLQEHVQAPDGSASADRSDFAAIFPKRRPGSGAWVRLFRPLMVITAIISGFGSAAAETLVDRGSYLVNTIMACGNCHTPKTPAGEAMTEKELSGGGLSFNTPVFTGPAANITPDPETGIGAWSDADIKRALTHGVRGSHGRLAGAPLAVMSVNFYKALLPRDLDAVVAYLRSVKPVRNEVPLPLYKAPTQHQPYPDAETGFTEDALNDPVRRGAYLVTIGHCMECHAAWAKGVWDYRSGLGKGGRQFSQSLVQGFPGTWPGSTAPNITSSKKSGIGGWTAAEIKRAITKGISRDGRALQPPMAYAWYAGMSEADLGAIVAWLRSLAPLE
jgi:mono/diheme cytochrome c family protein